MEMELYILIYNDVPMYRFQQINLNSTLNYFPVRTG